MKVSKALRKVMALWGFSNYLVSKKSGINRGTIGRILKGQSEGVTWETVERIAMGLENIDPVAKIAFLGTLALPDNTWIPEIGANEGWVSTEERPESIKKAMTAFDDLGLLNQEAIQQLKKQLPTAGGVPLTLEEWISIKMQQIRIKEEQED
jgi:hypothetical protein